MTASLKEIMKADLKTAMLARDTIRVGLIREVLSAITEFEKSRIDAVVDEPKAVAILSRASKQHKESLELATKAKRPELVSKEQFTLDILAEYMPKQMTPEEIREAMVDSFVETGSSEVNRVLGRFMKTYKGKADGAIARSIATEVVEVYQNRVKEVE